MAPALGDALEAFIREHEYCGELDVAVETDRVLDQRGQLLRAGLGFAGLPRPPYDPAHWALRKWLDSWAGIGRVAVGMARQGYDLQQTRYDERGWRAMFYTTGMEHSPTSAIGSAWEPTPWRAVQGAALDALRRASAGA